MKEVDLNSSVLSTISNNNLIFASCPSLEKVDISSWDLSNVESGDNIFANDYYTGTPEIFTIYVKDENSKNIVLSQRNNANIIIGAPSA